MDQILIWIHKLSGIPLAHQKRLFTSFVIVLFLWIIRTIAVRIVWRRTDNAQVRYRWQKGTIYVAVITGTVLVGRIWFVGIQSLATLVGLVAAGLAIALQDLVKSVAGFLFILWRKPFAVGDRIEIGRHRGDVIDIRLFKFTLMEIGNWVDAEQSTGRVIHLPNGLILNEVIANYSKGFEFIWNEIPVLVTFESNWEKAKKILIEISEKHAAYLTGEAEKRVKEASKRYMIYYTKLTPTVYTSVKDCGVMLTLRYLIEPRKRRGSEQGIWEEILKAFAQNSDIDFAYPTQRFYDNAVEGKEGTRPKGRVVGPLQSLDGERDAVD